MLRLESRTVVTPAGTLSIVLVQTGCGFFFLYISQLITSLQAVKKSEPRYCSVIWGPTCDSIDKITESYWIPELYVGDWLLVDNMGAYTVSITTDFNGFEKAHIYTVVTAETWHSLNLSPAYDIVH